MSHSCSAAIATLILAGSFDARAYGAPVENVIIVTAPGNAHDNDDATSFDTSEIARAGRNDVLGSLARNVPGLSLSDAQGNPWQPNLVYHGFVASPLQGNAQGLAVYLDGGRFNQPFGDTVNFDLLPQAAIENIAIKDATPVYGLNALGGAIVIATKTGRSAPGFNLSGAVGRYGRTDGSAEAGWTDGRASIYLALQESHDGGWRRHSPSTLYNGFADLGWDGDGVGIHLKLVGADSDLIGNGSAPVELLAADRRAIFTHPDNSRNRFGRVSIHPWVALSDTNRVEATLYLQRLSQRTLNGDAADVEGCADVLLCLESANDDELMLLIGADGQPIADTLGGEGYGALNRSMTRNKAMGVLVQLVDRRTLLSVENELILGFSNDRSRTHFRSSSELGALTNERGVEGLGPIITQPDGSVAPVDLKGRTDYWGLFLSDHLAITRKLSVEIGLRWNHADILLVDRIGTALNGRHRFQRLNPGIEFDYALSPGLTLRAGYAETNRAPSPAELACADENAPCSLTNFFVGDPPLKQVVAKSWEVGASGSVEGPWKLQWLLSGYRSTNHEDIQLLASGIRGRAFFQNVGQTRRQGFEASLGAIRGGWTIRLGYALTDATYRSPFTLNSPDNPDAGGDGRIAAKRGDRLPGIPRHRGVIAVCYAWSGFTLGGDIQLQSGQRLFGDEANLQPTTRGFAILNLRGTVPLLGSLSLFGEITNLFNRHYATFGTFSNAEQVDLEEAPEVRNPRSLGPGAPRRWFAGLRAYF